jgi:hypothetical protein
LEISQFNAQKGKFCEILRSFNPNLTDLPPHLSHMTFDNSLFTKLSPLDFSGLTIGGIDGGYTSRLLMGFDIFFFRAIAVFSTHIPGKIQKTSYYPQKVPALEIAVTDMELSALEFENIGSIRRAIAELQVANQVLELSTKKVDVLLLDGSPILKKPFTNNQRIKNYYQTYLSTLSKLVNQASKSHIKIAWIVKDSRMNILTQFLGKILPFILEALPELALLDYRGVINRSRDMDLFYYLLEPNIRSMSYFRDFSVSEAFDKKHSLYAFYLKPVPFDTPLRVEVFQPKRRNQIDLINEINIIGETILPLSQYNKTYGIPAPIVEADARAKIKEAEIDTLFQMLKTRFPIPEVMLRRRERSPWKF